MSFFVVVNLSLHVGKNDLLTFYDGDDLTANILGQYSGIRPHFKLYTSMADVTIQFQSDPATNIYGYNNGFVVHFFGKMWRSLIVLLNNNFYKIIGTLSVCHLQDTHIQKRGVSVEYK